MVLKIVRYLAQQGYGTDKIVILTPYLGQLRLLQECLKKDNDPVLNDLDSYDLVRAGLISLSKAKLDKKPIRIATIGRDSADPAHSFSTHSLLYDRQLPRRRKRTRHRVSYEKQCGS